MAILAPLFATGGVGIAFLHAATPDPLAELAALEPGEVVIVGRVASPPVPSSWGYRADVRVEHLWYEGREVLRGGGVEVFAGDLGGVGVGDRIRVDGEIWLPEPGEGDFDYARYLTAMDAAGYDGCITVEISVMVQRRPGYDPAEVARRSFATLTAAERAVGVALVHR